MEEKYKEIKKREFNWPRVLWYIHLHALGLYGLVLFFTEAKWLTVFFALFIILTAIVGVTVGAHRLWAHQSFTATWQVKMFLMLAHTLAGVGSIYDWVLAHRIHHKFYGTDKDPYNHEKGFFYSHILSNVMTPHPDQEKFERDVDMRDVDGDFFVWIQRRFYWPLYFIVGVLLPTNAPAEYWGETVKTSVFVLCFFRLAITMNVAWLVNSGRLIWGLKPGDKYPANDNSVFFVRKSYWPNYHYMLPWDWKTGEFGSYNSGFSSFVIKMLFELGLIESMKTTSSEDIRQALYKATSSKVSMEEVLLEVKRKAETEAMKQTLEYHH